MANHNILSQGTRFSLVALMAAACGLPDIEGLADDGANPALDGPVNPDGLTGDDANDPGDEDVDDGDDGAGIEFDFDCIKIDRAEEPLLVPPAGLRVNFRVRDCNGDPVPVLSPENLRVINDEKGEEFGAGKEGGGISDLGVPTSYGLYSVIALDMSDSIFKRGAVDHVIDGALTYLDKIAVTPSAETKHEVAVIAFGRPDAFEVVQSFTLDHTSAREAIEALRTSESRGSTDLYGAYLEGLQMVGERSMNEELSERFFVMLTDGTHESGNEEFLRNNALTMKAATSANIYVIGIEGNYDAEKLAELTTTNENFVHVDDALALQNAFSRVATRVDAAARSNYVVGVCSPIALGEKSSLTIQVQMDGSGGSEPTDTVTLAYDVAPLNGDVASCNPYDIAHNQLACDDEGVCTIACVAMECGCDAGIACGSCGEGTMCSEDNLCVPGDGPGPGDESCGDSGSDDPPGAVGIDIGILEANQGVGIKLAHAGNLIETSSRNAPLVRDREVTMRASWTLDSSWQSRPVLARLRIYDTEGVATVLDDTRDVAAASSFDNLDASFHWFVPAEAIQPGARYSVSLHEVDDADPGTSSAAAPRLPETGSAELGVPGDHTRLHVTLVPIRHKLDGCDKTGDATGMKPVFADALFAQYPVSHVELAVHPTPYTFTQPLTPSGWNSLVAGLSQQRVVDNARPDTFYYGVVRACGSTNGIGGVGYVPWNAGTIGSAPHRTSTGVESVRVFLHELGHNHGRKHVRCSGSEANVDANYPHAGGLIGIWGHDVNTHALYEPQRTDFMTYCGNNWISDYGWGQAQKVIAEIDGWAHQGRALGPDDRVLMGLVSRDGQATWWTAYGRVDSMPNGDAPAIEFYADGDRIAAVVPEYGLLSDDETLVITAPLPADFDRVTSFRHVDHVDAPADDEHGSHRASWPAVKRWTTTSIDDVNLVAR